MMHHVGAHALGADLTFSHPALVNPSGTRLGANLTVLCPALVTPSRLRARTAGLAG
jgi:hypothetical protein